MRCNCSVGEEIRQSAWKRKAKLAADRIYGELCIKAMAEVAAYAQEEKIDLVINSTPTSVVVPGGGCGIRDAVRPPSSRVIFSSHPDITDAIAKRLANRATPAVE